MLTFEKFQGVNNVQPPERLAPSELVAAVNVDFGLSGEARRRGGYSLVASGCHKNLWQAQGFMLATCDGVLTAIAGPVRTALHPALGNARVWCCNLPDGRTAFSNGNISGLTDGKTWTPHGVPVPPGIGAPTSVRGALFPGSYQYQITYVRLSDGLEGGSASSDLIDIPDGGVLLTGLPQQDGYSINVYLSSLNDDSNYLAGNTLTGAFSFLGANDTLSQPLRTEFMAPLPAGRLTTFWRGRILTAVGSLLVASMTNSWELHHTRRDFRQFSSPLTLIQPTDDGLYVGTETELVFLAGTEFDKLAYTRVLEGAVVLGSGVTVRGERIMLQQGVGQGTAMICLADSRVIAGFSGGSIQRMTEKRYRTGATEVFATFREVNGIPQYIAVPQ